MLTGTALALLLFAFTICVQHTIQQQFCDGQRCGLLRPCCNKYHCSNALAGFCQSDGCSWEGGFCGDDSPKKSCCPGFSCNNIYGGECEPNAAFYERCCDRFLCLDSNGQTTNNGTCRVDPTVTTTPFPCSPLHTECVVGGSENCCGDAKCSNATQVANEEGPEIQSGFCRNENETAPFCSGQTQFCLENACCPEFFCNLDQKSQRCQSEKPECRKEQELCEENGCCTGLICGIDKDNRFGQCVNIPTCGLEGQLCLNGTCCTGFFCDFARTEGANVGECSTIVKTTTTENEPTITEPTTTTVKTTTATLPTTTTSQGSCIAQGNLCLLDLLIDTCCAGFKCTGLLLGTCKPI